jgi:hypothetical protein
MMNEHDTEIQQLESEINRCCIAHDTAGAMKALTARRALEAAAKPTGRPVSSSRSIRNLSVLASVLVALALLPAMAFGASPLALAQAHARADFQPYYAQEVQLTPMQVACHGKPAHIVCRASALSVANGSAWHAVETLAVSHGKVRVLVNPYGVAP